jgi:PhoH-like ATPase
MKVFVIDASVPIHDKEAFERFGINIIVLPPPVLEDLVRHTRQTKGETAISAQNAIRLIDELSEKGNINEGVLIPTTGGMLVVDRDDSTSFREFRYDSSTTNNTIISVAKKWQAAQIRSQRDGHGTKSRKYQDASERLCHRFLPKDVLVVTKNIDLRVKARACSLTARDYFGDQPEEKTDQAYSGIIEIPVSEGVFQELSSFLHRKPTMLKDELSMLIELPPLIPNEGCVFSTETGKATLAIYKENGGKDSYFRYVEKPCSPEAGKRRGVRPKNIYQAFAYALLTDPGIDIVTINGIAGSGKTLMALLAGLEQLDKGPHDGTMQVLAAEKEIFEQILVYRPNIELGKELGFLPGTIEEKTATWARPILDNLELLERGTLGHSGEGKSEKGPTIFDVKGLVKTGKIAVETINFIQGRTLHGRIVIVDETQNFGPEEVKALVTRAGAGTMFVLTGDPGQIANPYLDKNSNGLTHAINRFKGQETFGHITLIGSLRSQLAEMAALLL